jgi:ribose 5-phosphate isomerase A
VPDPKAVAAHRAVEFVESGMTVGLGTGSTALFAVEWIGRRVREEGLSVRGVPTSVRTEKAAREAGIPLVSLDEVLDLDVTIDGADEVDPKGNLLKGGGGALLREKIVASITKTNVVVVAPEKRVERLGHRELLPVEVVRFGWRAVARSIDRLGGEAYLRRTDEGASYVTDEGHFILDCRFEDIADPADLERTLDRIPGVVETGLFVGLAHRLVVGFPDGRAEVRELGG